MEAPDPDGNITETELAESTMIRVEGDWEYRPLRIDGDVPRMTAAVRLAIQAEYAGWELSRVRLYPGGVRKVWLRRKRTKHMLPELSY